MTGLYVRWRHLNKETGMPVLTTAGVVRACTLGITGRDFMLLVECDDHTLVTLSASDVVVVPETHNKSQRRSLLDKADK